jgi:transposase
VPGSLTAATSRPGLGRRQSTPPAGSTSATGLSRAGNRRINHVLYMAGIVQLRNDTQGRRYYRRRLAEGKTSMEAMRCLRRRLSDVVYRQLVQDATRKAGPGGHSGASTSSSAADLTPVIGSSDQPLPDPRTRRYSRPPQPGRHQVREQAPHRSRAPGGCQRGAPAGRTALTPTSAAAPLQASRTRS